MLRIAIFIDANNVFHMCQKLGFNVDFMKLSKFLELKYLEHTPNIVLRRFYTGSPEVVSSGQKKFWNRISSREIGYSIIKRQLKEIRDDNGSINHKADMDATIGFDMADLSEQYDLLVLLCGDSDHERNLRVLIQQRDKKILIISTRGRMAIELHTLVFSNQANAEFIDISNIRYKIGREKK